MRIANCIFEAAMALEVPGELLMYPQIFVYDPADQEWRFTEDLEEPEILDHLKEWMEKMCGWLQYQYPDGPQAT